MPLLALWRYLRQKLTADLWPVIDREAATHQPQRQPSWPGRRLAVSLVLVAVGWCWLMVGTARHPWVSLGYWGSDHISHISATLLFLQHGTEIYRRPVKELCHTLPADDPRTIAAAAALRIQPADVCWSDSEAKGPPLMINWWELPRAYPPGHLLYFLPEALLYGYGGLSLKAVSAVAICKLVLVAHLCLWLLALALGESVPRGLAWLALGLAYGLLVPWALMGFYDGIAIAALLGGIVMLQREREAMAMALGGIAFCLHFRVLWYAPLFVYALARAAKKLRDRRRAASPAATDSRHRVLAGATLALGAVALVLASATFIALLPWFKQFPTNNRLYGSSFSLFARATWGLVLITGLTTAILATRRHGLLLATLLWSTWVMIRSPQIMPWHAGFLVPLLAMAALRSRVTEAPTERLGLVLGWLLLWCPFAFNHGLLPTSFDGKWIALVMMRLASS